jgi:hypothetical protein
MSILLIVINMPNVEDSITQSGHWNCRQSHQMREAGAASWLMYDTKFLMEETTAGQRQHFDPVTGARSVDILYVGTDGKIRGRKPRRISQK